MISWGDDEAVDVWLVDDKVVVDDSVVDDAADEGVGADWKEKKKLEFQMVY